MFQFARSDIQEKIDEYQVKYNQEMRNSREYEGIQKRIDQFLALRNKVVCCERKIPLTVIGGILSLLVLGFGDVLMAILYFTIPFSFMAIGLKAICDRNRYEKKMQNEYPEYFDLDMGYEEFKERSRHFSECSFNSYHRAMEYRDLIRSLGSNLEHINHCEAILEYSKVFFTDPYYLANDKEEYQELLSNYNYKKQNLMSQERLEELSNLNQDKGPYHVLCSYQNPKNQEFILPITDTFTDYSNIHFENGLEESTFYSENPKQKRK